MRPYYGGNRNDRDYCDFASNSTCLILVAAFQGEIKKELKRIADALERREKDE